MISYFIMEKQIIYLGYILWTKFTNPSFGDILELKIKLKIKG